MIEPPFKFSSTIDSSTIHRAIVGVEGASHQHKFPRERGNGGIESQRERVIRERAACPQDDLTGILVHHLHNKFGGCSGMRLEMRLTLGQWENNVGLVIRLAKFGGAVGL